MRPITVQVVTAGLLLAAALVVNPLPGAFLGLELTTPLWAGLFALALTGAALSIAQRHRPWSLVGLGLLLLPLMGPIHPFPSLAFFALVVAAWAAAVHLEALAFAQRLETWSTRLGGDPEAVEHYERAYARALFRLAGVLAAGLAAVVAAYGALVRWAPDAFALSLEARHPEGMLALLLVVATLVAAVVLLSRPTPDEEVAR